MAYMVPGSDARNTARWQALTPQQRAAEQAYVNQQQQITDARTNRGRRFGNLVGAGVRGVVGAAATGGALGALGAGGAAGAAPSASGSGFWSGVTAPTFGGGSAAGAAGGGMVSQPASRFTLGGLMKLAEIGVPAITSLFGMRSQNRALDRQSQTEQQNLAEQMAFAREQEARRQQEYERQMTEEARRYDIDERNRQRELTAAEEERAFNRRLLEERETRRAPYRQASRDALIRLQDLMRRGRR